MSILREIKLIYNRMEENEIPFSGGNILGHVVGEFCLLQNKGNFLDRYDSLTIGRARACTCDIEVNGILQMCIMTIPETTERDVYMKWLRNYMSKTKVSRGITIKGTLWNMIDFDGIEYSIDLSDDNITEEDFERFLIIRKENFMKKYNDDVMKAVRQSIGLDDENNTSKDKEIMAMDKTEVFERYCKWNGLAGCWFEYLLDAVESIYGVKLSQ